MLLDLLYGLGAVVAIITWFWVLGWLCLLPWRKRFVGKNFLWEDQLGIIGVGLLASVSLSLAMMFGAFIRGTN